jgi:hypothetical protein
MMFSDLRFLRGGGGGGGAPKSASSMVTNRIARIYAKLLVEVRQIKVPSVPQSSYSYNLVGKLADVHEGFSAA